MKPFFTIITPTVERESLIKCCASVDEQSFSSWQHVIAVDKSEINHDFMDQFAHPQRHIFSCGKSYRNGGNTPRHLAWAYATGEWLLHIDCDNYISDAHVLADLAVALECVDDQWALFSILRHGLPFYFDPPVPNYFDTANAVVRREIGRWPDIDDYASDGVWVNALREKYPYRAFPTFRPIVVMPTSSFGAGGGINGQ